MKMSSHLQELTKTFFFFKKILLENVPHYNIVLKSCFPFLCFFLEEENLICFSHCVLCKDVKKKFFPVNTTVHFWLTFPKITNNSDFLLCIYSILSVYFIEIVLMLRSFLNSEKTIFLHVSKVCHVIIKGNLKTAL